MDRSFAEGRGELPGANSLETQLAADIGQLDATALRSPLHKEQEGEPAADQNEPIPHSNLFL